MPPRYPHQSETGPWEDGCVSPYKTVYKSYCPRYGGSMVIISSINFNYALTRLDRRATLWDVQALGKSHLPLPTTVRFRELGLGGRLTFLRLGQSYFCFNTQNAMVLTIFGVGMSAYRTRGNEDHINSIQSGPGWSEIHQSEIYIVRHKVLLERVFHPWEGGISYDKINGSLTHYPNRCGPGTKFDQ